MKTKSLLKKGFAVGIIILLGMSITTMAESLTVEKDSSMIGSLIESNTVMKTSSRGFYIHLSGTMGKNGWYVSWVEITITADNGSEAMHTYYKFHDADPWTEYMGGPLGVYVDGYYSFSALIIDQFGNQWYLGPVQIKIDQTPPTLNVTVTHNFWKTRWEFKINVSDGTSGVGNVAIYIDDILVGNITPPGPYSFIYKGHGKTVQIFAYDMAGNSANSSIITPCIQSWRSLNSEQKIVLFHSLIYNIFIHCQMKGWSQ